MPAKRFQLNGPTLEAIQKKVGEYGPGAKIIAADKVRVGGWLGSTTFQAIVELPGRPEPAATQPVSTQRRIAITSLLDDVNEREAVIHGSPLPSVSTSTPGFESVLEALSEKTLAGESRIGSASSTPAMASQAGDLIILAGVGGSAVLAAQAAASRFPGGVVLALGGSLLGQEQRIDSPKAAMGVRAKGVLSGKPVILAYGLGTYLSARSHAPALISLDADQTWLVVDVSRKHEDTAAWVEALRPALEVTALAVTGTQETGTPRSARSLGIPVGWIDTGAGEYHAA